MPKPTWFAILKPEVSDKELRGDANSNYIIFQAPEVSDKELRESIGDF